MAAGETPGPKASPGVLSKLIAAAAGVIRLLEKLLRPRLAPLVDHGWLRQLHAVMMFIAPWC